MPPTRTAATPRQPSPSAPYPQNMTPSTPTPTTAPQPPNPTPPTPITFETALSPKLFTEAISKIRTPLPAPWGVPSSSRRPQYPASIPNPLRDLIALIPLQPEPIGRNIRPLIISICSTFTPGALNDIAAILGWAPQLVRKDLANFVAGMVRWCWLISAGLASDFTPEGASGRINANSFMIDDLDWALERDQDVGTRWWRFVILFPFHDPRLRGVRWSRNMDGESLFHFVCEHLRIWVHPDLVGGEVSVVMEGCECEEFKIVRESDVRAFVGQMPLDPGSGEGDESCGICLEGFGQEGGEERVKLGCGHVMGRACLSEWLVEAETKTCPLCRYVVKIPEGMGEREFRGGECHLEALP